MRGAGTMRFGDAGFDESNGGNGVRAGVCV